MTEWQDDGNTQNNSNDLNDANGNAENSAQNVSSSSVNFCNAENNVILSQTTEALISSKDNNDKEKSSYFIWHWSAILFYHRRNFWTINLTIVRKNGDPFKPLKIRMSNLEYLMLYKLK